MSKKPLYQLFEDGDLSEQNHRIYDVMKDTVLSNMHKHTLTTLSHDVFRDNYDQQIRLDHDLYQSKFVLGIGKTRDNMINKLILTPMIEKNKTYILAEMIAFDTKNSEWFKETHHIPFPIQYLDFTNQEFDVNFLTHESNVRALIFNSGVKPHFISSFKEDVVVIRKLATSFKDVFI